MSALPKRCFTPEEYLELEGPAEYRSQYVSGEIFAMAGTQMSHNEIVGNIVGMFYVRFRGRPCRTYFQDVRLRVESGELYTYPDVMVLCGAPKLENKGNPPSLLNPQVIFEVLSATTEAFDRGDKFARYRRLDTLTDYVLVTPWKLRVEHHRLQDNGVWTQEEHTHPGDVLRLSSVGCELPLGEIYERVTFSDA